MMISCQDFRDSLDDFIDGEVTLTRSEALVSHARRCTPCRVELRRAEETKRLLRDIPAPGMPENFARQQFDQLWSSQPSIPEQTGRSRILPALVATLFLGVILGAMVGQWQGDRSMKPEEVVTLKPDEVREVAFAINSTRDFEQVSLTLVVPDNMEIVGLEGQKRISWQTQLTRGQNMLRLPVRSLGVSEGLLTIEVHRVGRDVVTRSMRLRAIVSRAALEPQTDTRAS
jgi:anti-sigma factor RsiW